MNKVLIVIAVVVLAAAGAGAAWYFRGVDETTMTQRALAGNGSVTCTFVDADTDQEGTLYVSNGDTRITMAVSGLDTVFVDQDQDEQVSDGVLFHVLTKDETVYMWNEGDEEGILFPAENSAETGTVLAVDYEDDERFENEFERNQFSCRRGVDTDLFEVPDDVEFVDYGNLFALPDGPGADTPEMTDEELDEMQRQFE